LILAGAVALCILATRMSAWAVKTQSTVKSNNPLVTALWFSHMYAEPQALTPSKDSQLKATLVEALHAKKPGLSWNSMREVFEKRVFQTLAGANEYITRLGKLIVFCSTLARNPCSNGHHHLQDLVASPSLGEQSLCELKHSGQSFA